jgi:hypothetical protein
MEYTKKLADREKMDQSLALLMESWSISTLDMLRFNKKMCIFLHTL